MLDELITVRISAEQRARLDALARELGRSIGELVREALSPVVAGPVCPVCQTPRRVGDPDPLADTMAHAQCDQRLAELEESAQ